jgi:hypothetical protein
VTEDDEPWTSIVIAHGESRQHGRDPRNLATTLCGEVAVTPETLMRGPFYGTGHDDCEACARLLPDNHY